jgi:hypothetical protein
MRRGTLREEDALKKALLLFSLLMVLRPNAYSSQEQPMATGATASRIVRNAAELSPAPAP